jgi:hypothetical protein
LIALTLSPAPEGFARWSLPLLEEKVVELHIVDRASDNTIGRTLKTLIMEANPSVPAKTVLEFIAYAKANPGKPNVASSGNGNITHVSGEHVGALMSGVPGDSSLPSSPIIGADDERRGISVREQPSAWIARDLQPSLSDL